MDNVNFELSTRALANANHLVIADIISLAVYLSQSAVMATLSLGHSLVSTSEPSVVMSTSSSIRMPSPRSSRGTSSSCSPK